MEIKIFVVLAPHYEFSTDKLSKKGKLRCLIIIEFLKRLRGTFSSLTFFSASSQPAQSTANEMSRSLAEEGQFYTLNALHLLDWIKFKTFFHNLRYYGEGKKRLVVVVADKKNAEHLLFFLQRRGKKSKAASKIPSEKYSPGRCFSFYFTLPDNRNVQIATSFGSTLV